MQHTFYSAPDSCKHILVLGVSERIDTAKLKWLLGR